MFFSGKRRTILLVERGTAKEYNCSIASKVSMRSNCNRNWASGRLIRRVLISALRRMKRLGAFPLLLDGVLIYRTLPPSDCWFLFIHPGWREALRELRRD